MTPADIDALEQELFALGKTELAIEQSLSALRSQARNAAQLGQADKADEAWNLYQAARQKLNELRQLITGIEVRLYTLRRRLRKS